MSERLYVLLPDTTAAERVVDALRAAGVDETALHAVARHDPHTDLPEAGLLDTTEVAPAAGRGAAAGAAVGVVAGLTAMVFPPLGLAIGGGAVAATGLAGAGFGAWVASMIGISEESDVVAECHDAIAAGQVLLLIDTDDEDAADIEHTIRQAHPRATPQRAER